MADAIPKHHEDLHAKSSLIKSVGTTLTIVGSALGFGSLWRFPEQVAHHGGAVFLIYYIIGGTLYAIPMLVLEAVWGQLSRGTLFDGGNLTGNRRFMLLGWSILSSVAIMCYYPTILSYAGWYLIHSFAQPWYPKDEDFSVCATFSEAVCASASCPSTDSCACSWNPASQICKADMFKYAQAYFDTVTIPNQSFSSPNPTPGWGYVEKINWSFYGVYAVNIILMTTALMFGDTILRWVSYLTMLPAFVIIIGLCIFNFTLDGASEGLKFFGGNFEASKLLDVSILKGAISQVIFACSLGLGIVPALSAMNKTADPIGTPSWIVVYSTTIFSLISGMTVFTMLGYLSKETDNPIVAPNDGGLLGTGGTGLIFVTYSCGISTVFDGGVASGVLQFLFWLVIYTLGFTSAISPLKGFTHVLLQSRIGRIMFRNCSKREFMSRVIVLMICCGLQLVSGLIACSDYGVYLVSSIDHYTGNLLMPMSAGLGAFIFSWCLNNEWYTRQYGPTLRLVQSYFLATCLFFCCLNKFVFQDKQTQGWIWLVFAVILPMIQPFVFAIVIHRKKEMPYLTALDLSWNGALGDVFDRIHDVINHDGRRFLGGGTFRHMAGMIRNMSVPLVLGLVCDTLTEPGFMFNFSPSVNPMPPWFALASNFWPFVFLLTLLFSFFASHIIYKWLSCEEAHFSEGLFLKEEYAFGLYNGDKTTHSHLHESQISESTSSADKYKADVEPITT